MPRVLRETDLVVSMPKLKTHHWVGVTLSLKNCFGCMPGSVYGWPKDVFHVHGIPESIVDIAAAVRPSLAIIDGIVGMEGDGPIMGDPVPSGVVVISRDLVAADVTAARLMGMDPEKVDYLMEAGRFLGQSRSELIEQRGEDPSGSRRRSGPRRASSTSCLIAGRRLGSSVRLLHPSGQRMDTPMATMDDRQPAAGFVRALHELRNPLLLVAVPVTVAVAVLAVRRSYAGPSWPDRLRPSEARSGSPPRAPSSMDMPRFTPRATRDAVVIGNPGCLSTTLSFSPRSPFSPLLACRRRVVAPWFCALAPSEVSSSSLRILEYSRLSAAT